MLFAICYVRKIKTASSQIYSQFSSGTLLYSYASLDCITVFFPNHFYCCVLPYVYNTTRVTLELKSPVMGILYSSCSLC